MAHARIDRKGFLKSLGVAAAACAVRPASAAAASVSSTTSPGALPVAKLPRQTLAATRIVAYRARSV